MGTKLRACFLIAVMVAAFGITVGTASGAIINVSCGDVTALRNAITTANGTAAADVIEIADVDPCVFTLTNFFTAAASGNTGLPTVVQPLTINGHGATIERSGAVGTPLFRLFLTGAPLELNDLTLLRGALSGSSQNGAGVASFQGNVVLNRAVLLGNTATGGNGGGVATVLGELHIHQSTIAFNSAANGGGINTTQTPTEVRRSTLFVNSATGSTGGALIQGSTATFENDTFSVNLANNSLGGLGVVNSGNVAATVAVVSSTFADNGRTGNPAPTAPGGALFALANGANATINVTDTIVTDTDSTADPLLAPCAALSITGTAVINDNGGNLEWPHNTCNFDTVANPQLAALADNGGGTATYRLLPNSPAIDLGGADCPATDQRGQPRPDGDGCDTGSFETNPPETTADGPDGPTNDPEITFTSDEPGSTFRCSVDGADPVPCTSPFDPDVTGDGEHTVTVQAVDSEGYFDPSPASVTFTLDTTPPVVEITSSPSSPTSDDTATIEFTVDDDDADVTCQVDDGDPVSCTSPFTTEPLDDGEHTITVTATDEAGNSGSDSVTFVVDVGAPDTTITSGPSGVTHSASATFTFEASEAGSTFECRVDGSDWSACSSPHTVTVAPGTHTFEVRAIDSVGNVDPTPASRTWEYQVCRLVRIGPFNLFGIVITVCL